MHVSTKDQTRLWKNVLLVDRSTGEVIQMAFEADSDGGWHKKYVLDPNTGRVKMTAPEPTHDGLGWRREFVVEHVIDKPFDIVDKYTGEVLAESK